MRKLKIDEEEKEKKKEVEEHEEEKEKEVEENEDEKEKEVEENEDEIYITQNKNTRLKMMKKIRIDEEEEEDKIHITQNKNTRLKMMKKIRIDEEENDEGEEEEEDKIHITKNKNTRLNIKQVFRKDLLTNMLLNKELSGKKIFNMLINENKEIIDERRRGWIFESLCQILIMLKCIENINYTEIYSGQLQNLKQIKNITNLLKVKIDGGGNNIIDMAIKKESTFILFTIKYKNKYSETDVSKIDNTIISQNILNNYKISLIVRNKELVIKHKYKNKKNIDKQIHDKIIENGMLFDENDVIKGLDIFCQRFSSNALNVDDFIDFINAEYLLSSRQQLIQKLHQKMTLIKFENSFLTNKRKMWCIAHKPRSGKSITILLICKYLLENNYNKILIMTSVPATINSFVNDLEKYIDFKNINYKFQEEFDTINETFNGIVFCSVQYLKIDGKNKKKDLLKKIGFDAIIADESHQGSSTNKTKTEILDVDNDVEEIRKNIKLNIFASGTADKTKKYYGIYNSYVYEWEIEDEAYMKELINPIVKNREDIINYMVRRHGNTFIECLENTTLNKDYSKHPTQVLMKHNIDRILIEKIEEFNKINNTKFGYNCSSLFALQQTTDEKGEITYDERFELEKTSEGIDILIWLLDCIISDNKMKGKDKPEFKTIMTKIEETQFANKSRQSTKRHPLLFIIYLPTHTRNNTIDKLQKTFKRFLETYNLWNDYNIEYSNSIEDTGNIKEEYNDYIQTIMNKTKTENKKGCILLLGNKGSVGITYNDCDVTISLDDGHNLDNQKQRFSRALTEADGKTIGINVDMNIQRSYLYLIDMIQKHRINTKTTKTNAEILYYLFEHNIFLFDPQQINNGKMTTVEIMSYYQKEAENIIKEIDDTLLLENLSCNDEMREILMNVMFEMKIQQKHKINEDLNGEQQDCPKGDKTKIQIDTPDIESKIDEQEDIINDDEIILINKTLELCKYLFPYLAIISKSYKIFDFKEILIHQKTRSLIISFLEYKKIELNKDKYILIVNIMNNIIDNNEEIVNNIREIYSIAPANKLRSLIEKHFIPTNDEKKQNAEVPTPVKLVNEMLDKIPLDFWKTPQKVFEPCCGKGNFILGIFDKFYEGLKEIYPDEIERCRIIMTECIYYADLTALNVFITTEIMKCHVQSYCGLDEFDYEFNKYIGDTLELNIEEYFTINGFNAVVGNPPYNDNSGNKGKGHTLWTVFIEKSLKEWLLIDGYLLFVNPSLWRQPEHPLQQLMKSKQIIYLEIHDEKDGLKTFKCNTRYDVYLIQNKAYEIDTIIKTQKGEIININLTNWDFIPNYKFNELKNLIDNTEEKINVLYSRSDYASDKKWVKKEKTNVHKYPVAYSVNRANEVRIIWSEINTKEGHYGVPKVIFGSGATGFIIDKEGKYACSEFCTGIVDDVENLENIATVLNSNNFKDIILATSVSKAEINRKILKYFKKNFWREFI
jgi:hypothetical protein